MTRYLALGAHPDDVELGCGATLFTILKPNDCLMYNVMSSCSNVKENGRLVDEWETASECFRIYSECKHIDATLHYFPNRSLEKHRIEIRDILDQILQNYKPEIVFTTSPKDLHQDHSYLGRESISTFRDSTILTYLNVRPSKFVQPDYYVALNKLNIKRALKTIQCYKSMENKPEFDPELIKATFRHRGGEIRQQYAQAFKHIRTVIQ